ncbi:MAG TPA: PqiC family protein [Kiritimatiellia bacterium]|nr:PqiC family protein [Kiritimatiellia bacterium]
MNAHIIRFIMPPKHIAAAVAIAGGLLIGCSTTPAPRLYVFAPRDGWQHVAVRDVESSDYTIRFAAIKLPAYLDRPQMVTRVSDNEIKIDQFNRWGIPLHQTILELLGGALAKNLPNAYVDVMTATSRQPPGYLVQVEIVRLDGFLGGPVELIAQWRVQRGGPSPATIVQKLGRYEQESATRSYDAYVDAIRHALVAMGDDIASAIDRDRQEPQHADR